MCYASSAGWRPRVSMGAPSIALMRGSGVPAPLLLAFRFAALTAALCPAGALARTIIVPDQYATITEALHSIGDYGDTVLVRSGVYPENVTTDSPGFRLIGESGPDSTVIVGGITTPHWDGHIDYSIRGFTVRGGGGIWISTGVLNGRVRVSQCIVDGNDKIADPGPGLDGGGIYIQALAFSGTPLVFVDSTVVRRNHGRRGGGIFLYGTHARITDCVVTDNSAEERGGGIYLLAGGRIEVFRTTVAGNEVLTAEGEPGAGIEYMGTGPQARFTLSNAIVALNVGGFGVSCASLSNEPDVSCSDAWGNEYGGYAGNCPDPTGTNGNFSLDPLFCDLPAGDYRLAASSPCAAANSPPGCGTIGALGVGCAASAVSQSIPTPSARLRIEPNPARAATNIFLGATPSSSSRLAIYDSSGRLLDLIHPMSGRVRWTPGPSCPAGIYFVRLFGSGISETAKLVIIP